MENQKRVHLHIMRPQSLHQAKNSVAALAKKLKLTGFVNAQNEGLEVVVEGHKDHLWELIREITTGRNKTRYEKLLFYFKLPNQEFTQFSLN